MITTIIPATSRSHSWRKVVTGVDPDRRGGYAFEGPFVSEGRRTLPAGTLLICCDEMGHGEPTEYRLLRLQQDGAWVPVPQAFGVGAAWSHQMREIIAQALQESIDQPAPSQPVPRPERRPGSARVEYMRVVVELLDAHVAPSEAYEEGRRRLRERMGLSRLPAGLNLPDREFVHAMAAKRARRRLTPPPPLTLEERLRRQALLAALEALQAARYREPSSSNGLGGSTICQVLIGDVPTARGEARKEWHKKYMFSGNDAVRQVVIRRNWLHTVYRQQLAVVDGLFTLEAAPVEAPDGYTAWEATWAEQSRGFDLRVATGYIIRDSEGHTTHGSSVRQAIRTLEQRVQAEAEASEQLGGLVAEEPHSAARRIRHRRPDQPDERVRPYLTNHQAVLVTIADSLAAGNCAPGTEDWVNRYMPGRESATVGELLRVAYETMDRTRLVAAACLAAVRRHLRTAQPGA